MRHCTVCRWPSKNLRESHVVVVVDQCNYPSLGAPFVPRPKAFPCCAELRWQVTVKGILAKILHT